MASQRDGGIAWCDETWNPVRGCSRVSEGCRNCYAERVAARHNENPKIPTYHGFAEFKRDALHPSITHGPRWTGRVELIPDKLDEPLRWWKPRKVFVNSMSDLFHERLSDEAIAAVFGVMAACPQHTFQVLTKRPERMWEWFEWVRKDLNSDVWMLFEDATNALDLTVGGLGDLYQRSQGAVWPLHNVWLGVSVEDQATADERIPLLLQTPAALRFVFYEPALGPVDFDVARYGENNFLRGLHWLIVGGESGPGARPFDIAWARSVVAQCKAAGVPVFVKQLGAQPIVYRSEAERIVAAGGRVEWDDSGEHTSARLVLRDRKGGIPSEWPEDLRVREFPEVPK